MEALVLLLKLKPFNFRVVSGLIPVTIPKNN